MNQVLRDCLDPKTSKGNTVNRKPLGAEDTVKVLRLYEAAGGL